MNGQDATSKAGTAQPLDAGQKFGAWTVTALDSLGKRAFVRCACGTARQMAVESLVDGSAPRGCGCTATPRAQDLSKLWRRENWRRPDWGPRGWRS